MRPNKGDFGKPLAWLHGEIKTPPFSSDARAEAGFLLRRLQEGDVLSMPQSRPMPSIGSACHELRITDKNKIWRIIYRIESDLILILEIFEKKSQQTPKTILKNSKARLAKYLKDSQEQL